VKSPETVPFVVRNCLVTTLPSRYRVSFVELVDAFPVTDAFPVMS
jgi:hypothetical protein